MVASNDLLLEHSDGGELVMSSVAEGGIIQIVHQPNGWVRKQLIKATDLSDRVVSDTIDSDLELLNEIRI